MLLLIDNYDSFTYNLVHYLGELGAEAVVHRNDALTVQDAIALRPDAIVISPGPCDPDRAGITLPLVRAAAGRIPVLGVCLGHQAIAQAFGATVGRADRIMHGKLSPIEHDGTGVFADLPSPFAATRYHSLTAVPETVPAELKVNARTADGTIMGLRHESLPIHGVQFHPESIETEHGHRLLRNFLELAQVGGARVVTAELQRFKELIGKAATGAELSEGEAGEAFALMMTGNATPAQVAGLLMALRVRGETVGEITAGARSLRERMVRVAAPADAVDTCGTGGDGAGTYNISTAAAIVAAGAGVPVAKHGNRSLSSRSGSAEVLAQLGVNVDADFPLVERSIREAGIGFMMAPRHHGAMRHVAGPRVELGTRTIFNLLGPLANPAGVGRQLMGVFAARWIDPLAEVLGRLGSRFAWVVHGSDGLDELTTTGPTLVAEWDGGRVRRFEVTPEEAGLPRARPEDLKGGDPAHNADAIRAVLAGGKGPLRDAVVLGAAGALVVAGRAEGLRDAAGIAARSIDSGAAQAALEGLVRISNAPAAAA